MTYHYANRSAITSHHVTVSATLRGLAQDVELRHQSGMFDRDRFLSDVLKAAGTQAAIARALDLPTSRIADLYKKEKGKGQRRLTMEEGMRLAMAFNVWPCDRVNAERLTPVLRVCLRYAPKDGWTDQDVERLAQEIEYGLELLGNTSPSRPSQDAVDVASRAIADRFRDKLA